MARQKPDVRVGQVWADNDSRYRHHYVRALTVVGLDDTHATCETAARRRVRIRLDRFKPTSTGYRLLKNVEG